jgi:acetyltransferase-like isoleucine patch superfamily enzyme
MIKKLFVKTIPFALGRLDYKISNNLFNRIIQSLKKNYYLGRVSAQIQHLGSGNTINNPFDIKGGEYIVIGSNTFIGGNGVISAWDNYQNEKFIPQITIGDDVIIMDYCHLTSINKIEIRNGTIIGRWVTITDNSHGKMEDEDLLTPPIKRNLYSPGPVVIDENVWIGDKVTILPNVYIGKNAIVGANSVVTKDIPDNCVAAGVPAKVIKTMEKNSIVENKSAP